jgi:hypothetical protein
LTPGELFVRWLVAFALTQAVECPIYVRAFRVRLRVAFAASAITHPVVCFVFPVLWRAIYLAAVTGHPSWTLSPGAYFVGYGALAEPFAVVVEAAWLIWRARLAPRRAFVASIVANTASALAGLVCSWLTGWP